MAERLEQPDSPQEPTTTVPPLTADPRIALQDYRTEYLDLRIVCNCADEQLPARLARLAGMKNGLIILGFSQKFSPEVCRGVSPMLVTELDTMSAEMNTLYQEGQLTRSILTGMMEHMEALCR